MSQLTENIREGAPIESPVILLAVDILSIFENKEAATRAINEAQNKLIEYLGTLGPREDIEFFYTMEIKTDDKTLEKKIVLSPSALISTIIYNLNIKQITNDNLRNLTVKELSELMKIYAAPRLENLRKITKQKELQKKFPSLYLKFCKQSKQREDLKMLAKNINLLKISDRVVVNNVIKSWGYKNANEFIKSKNLSVAEFVDAYAEALEAWTTHIPEIAWYMKQIEVDFNNMTLKNQEKLELYLASQFLKAAQTYGGTSPQRYLIFVANYFKKHPEKKTDDQNQITYGKVENEEFGASQPGITVSAKSLYDEYKQFVISHPEIQLLTFDKKELDGMNLEEAEEYVRARLEDIQANWSFLPKEEFDQVVISTAPEISHEEQDEETKKAKQEHLIDLFMEKKELYEQTDPFFRIKGNDTFDGYIGYIYPNGKVILDKFFENAETGRVADGQAIYIMDFTDFARLSVLPKSELIDNPACRRIIHAGDWQSRVTKEIESTGTSKPAVTLQKLATQGAVEIPR